MRTFVENTSLDLVGYGGLIPKHQVVVDRQRDDRSTVLGNYRDVSRIPAPPRNSSAETMAELDLIVERQRKATGQEFDFAIAIDRSRDHYRWWSENVESVTGAKHPVEEFHRIADVSEGFLMWLKDRFDRARPYQLAPLVGRKVRMVVADPRTPAYPSGHSFEAHLFALHLTDAHPDRGSRFLELARLVGDSRVVGGVHYPSDVEAGRIAAGIAHEVMLRMGMK